MDIYQVVDALKDHINSFMSTPDDPEEEPVQLYYAYDDPDNENDYMEKLTASTPVPVVIIDAAADGTQFITGGEGLIHSQNHYLTLLFIANANESDKATARAEVMELRDAVVGKIESIDDHRMRIFPIRQNYLELFIGSLKVTGIELTIRIEV